MHDNTAILLGLLALGNLSIGAVAALAFWFRVQQYECARVIAESVDKSPCVQRRATKWVHYVRLLIGTTAVYGVFLLAALLILHYKGRLRPIQHHAD